MVIDAKRKILERLKFLRTTERTNLHVFSLRLRRLSKNHSQIDCRSIISRDSRVAASFAEAVITVSSTFNVKSHSRKHDAKSLT